MLNQNQICFVSLHPQLCYAFDSSHAVLEIKVTRKQSAKYPNQVIKGKLALVDLAGRFAFVHP